MIADIASMQMQAALEKLAQGGGMPAQASAESAEKFQSLMQTAKLAPPAAPGGDGFEVAGRMIEHQQAQIDQLHSDLSAFEAQAPEMSIQEASVGSMRLATELASEQFDMQAKMAVVNTSKGDVDSLMKNQ